MRWSSDCLVPLFERDGLCHMGGGGGAGAGTSGTPSNSTAQVYQPQAQPLADTSFQSIISGLLPYALNGGATSPAGINYPTAQNTILPYFRDTDLWQPGLTAAEAGGAFAAKNLGVPGGLFSEIVDNPYYQEAFDAGTIGSGYGTAGAATAAADATAGATAPAYLRGLGTTTASPMAQLQGGATQVLNTGFDPRSALFNRTQNQVMDQASVLNAMAGLGSSPYGASTAGRTLSNFDIDWQNKQLGRQGEALGYAGTADTAAGRLGLTGGELYNLASGVAKQNLDLSKGAMNLQDSAGMVRDDIYSNYLAQVGQGLKDAAAGANTLTGLADTRYGLTTQDASNALYGLGKTIDIGNNQFLLPEEVLSRLQSYMQLGQSASGLSGTLGNYGVNQGLSIAQGIGGLASGANSLFGNNGLFSSGGLFGGGSVAAPTLSTLADGGSVLSGSLAGPASTSFAAGDALGGLGSFDIGGSAASSVLPLALS